MFDHLADPLKAIEDFIELSRSLSSERSLSELLDRIIQTALQVTGAEAGRVYILDRSNKFLRPEVVLYPTGKIPSEYLSEIALYGASGKEERSTRNPVAFSVFNGSSVHLEDIYAYSGFDCEDFYQFDRYYRYRSKSLLITPLKSSAGFVIGALLLLNYRDIDGNIGGFSDSVRKLAAAFASQAAIAIDNAKLLTENRRLIEMLDATNQQLEDENRQLKRRLNCECRFDSEIIGESPAMQRVFSLVEKVVDSDATVLITGETGTGKEVFAHAIHNNGNRKNAPFVAQNCAALPENLLESELFGYKKGAFSGAEKDKKGMIQAANGGTLFLDEIGDMPLGLQAKVLRFLQEFEVRPLGGLHNVKVDVRVIAATHRNLEELILEGRFREDLYYRLHIFPVELPPLRRRKEDVPSLVKYFVDKYSSMHKKKVKGISPGALDAFIRYDYPGNVRELGNLIERAVLICEQGEHILPEHVGRKLYSVAMASAEGGKSIDFEDALESDEALKEILAKVEAELIERRLQRYRWNQTKTAETLNISRRSLIDKMNRYNVRGNA